MKVSELHVKHWSTLSLYLGDDGVLGQLGGGGGAVDVQDHSAAQALMVTPADIQQGCTDVDGVGRCPGSAAAMG